MEYAHGIREKMFYREDEEEEEKDRHERSIVEGHCFLPINSSASSSSSALVLHWVDGSETSSSTTPATTGPTPAAAVEMEQMFAKVVTPSDVGKLNRLVIPKQHAEKYFPLDASTHDKGLLLNFEDRNGKPWRFRYSYWNSSQSYVMTKGWSRFVKEKHLDAGDSVLFGRGVGGTASDRLFIDWKKRPDHHFKLPAFLRIPSFPSYHHSTPSSSAPSTHHHPYLSFSRSSTTPWAAGHLFVPNATPSPAANYCYPPSAAISTLQQPSSNSVAYPPVPMVLDSVPIGHGKPSATTNHVRIFGVNLYQPREVANNSDTASLLRLQLQSPLSSTELYPQGMDSSLASFTSSTRNRGAKESQH